MKIMLLYIDPGSGSYLVQAIIAGVLGALFYFKNIWFKIKSFVQKMRRTSPSETEEKDA
jgi:hypothetical protein